jgi:hypothetical protein
VMDDLQVEFGREIEGSQSDSLSSQRQSGSAAHDSKQYRRGQVARTPATSQRRRRPVSALIIGMRCCSYASCLTHSGVVPWLKVSWYFWKTSRALSPQVSLPCPTSRFACDTCHQAQHTLVCVSLHTWTKSVTNSTLIKPHIWRPLCQRLSL